MIKNNYLYPYFSANFKIWVFLKNILRKYQVIKKEKKTEEFICFEFNFSEVQSVELIWADSLNAEPKLYDCSFDDAMSGLDVYALCLKNGKLVCILSNKGGLLSVKEISIIALKYGIVNAALFDGGAALQYQYTSEDFDLSFSALNNNFSFGEKIDEIFFTSANTHFPARSLVYLTIKHVTTTTKKNKTKLNQNIN